MNTSTALTPARDRVMGSLFLASGVTFVLGVLNPPVVGTWGDSPTEVLATAVGHKAAWCASVWLITLSVVAGVAGVTMLARTLRTDLARIGHAVYLAGAALLLASMTFELTVTSSQIGVPVAPDWYFGIEKWSDGLATAFFALLAPAAMACLGVEMIRTRRTVGEAPRTLQTQRCFPSTWSTSASNPLSSAIGDGGHPGMWRSTGTTSQTPPTHA